MHKTNKLIFACLLIMLSCLLVVGCKTKPKDQNKLTYDYQLLSEKFQKRINQESHNTLFSNQSQFFYLNPEEITGTQYKFLVANNLRMLKERMAETNDNQIDKYTLLSQEEKQSLSSDLTLLAQQSQIEKNFLDAIKPELHVYSRILEFNDEKSWFDGISFDYSYFDLNFLDIDDKNYIGNVDFDIVFNYHYKNATNQTINSTYQEEISLTITNHQSIIDQMIYLHTDLRTDLIKDKFAYAWIDAQQLLITEYEKMFNLTSDQFAKLFAFNAFEKSFLKYIKKNNPVQTENESNQNYELVFKSEQRFSKYEQIAQVETIDLAQPNYGAQDVWLDDSNAYENWNNTQLYKTIFGSLNPYDKIILENKLVLGNQYLYGFLQANWLTWLKKFQSEFKQKFALETNSAIAYGEIYLNDMAFYFEEFDYYHPIQKVSYYTAISIDKSEEIFLNRNSFVQSGVHESSSIFKAIYLNTFQAIRNFQALFGIRELNWTKVSEAESLIKFDPEPNFDFWESIARIKNVNIFQINERLSMVDSITMINEQRKNFLTSNNNDFFHLQILANNDLKNYPIIKSKAKEIAWSTFEKTNDELLTINVGLAFINISFVIGDKKFYTFEKSLLKI